MTKRREFLSGMAAVALCDGEARAGIAPGGGNWPQWRGPNRDGVSRETGLLKQWPSGGPPLLYKAVGLGGGYSTPSIGGGRVFGMGYVGNDEVIWALNESTSAGLWRVPIANANTRVGYPEGSRSTPTVDGDLVYALGVSGDLVCVSAADGKAVWQHNLVREFGGNVPNWGYSESPLIDGDRVIATPGGRQATLVAFNKLTGAVIWRAPAGDSAQYSSCIAADVDGVRQYIAFTSGGLLGVAAQSGQMLWRVNHAANNTANCPTPIFRDNHVFIAAGYGKGCCCVRLSGGGVPATTIYTERYNNHHGGMVLVGDHIYGCEDGGSLICFGFKTGQLAWQNRAVGKGATTCADGMLYVRGEFSRGSVALVETTSSGFQARGMLNLPESSGRNQWAHPVVAGGRLYLRDQDNLFCYNVRA